MIKISIPIPNDLALRIEAWLCELESSHWGLLKEKDEQDFYVLQGFFNSQEEADTDWVKILQTFPELPKEPAYESLQDKDWQEAYKAYLKPWSSGDLHWVPIWEKDAYQTPENAVKLYFDAGMAFGTGSHETTQLCARRLLDFKNANTDTFLNKKIIDAGCGSGILAISAKLLGFNSVYGFDIDDEAVTISKQNLGFNQLPATAVTFETAGLENGLAGKKADLVLANIQADVLVLYINSLLNAINPGGTLVLSGILSQELETVKSAFKPAAEELWGQATLDTRSQGEWVDICLKRD